MKQLTDNPVRKNNQAGVTLIISLVILLAMTIVGITSIQSTQTEISMAGNLRELGLTFNAAETALSDAEGFVTTSISKSIYNDPTKGLYDDSATDPEYDNPDTWATVQEGDTVLAYSAEPSKFIVKYLGDRSQNEVAAVNIGGYGSSQPGMTVSNFRITARGTGQSGNASRYLQSYYGKEF